MRHPGGVITTVPGERWVSVEPRRLEGWLGRYVAAHGLHECRVLREVVEVVGEDGTVARCMVPFPPLEPHPDQPWGGLLEHSLTERRVGVLLVRLGGYAAGIFEGRALVSSKVGSRQVHGRSSAGGWSQQRFARRREGQAVVALAAAADNAVRILVPEAKNLDAVVLGGDRTAVDATLADRRLEPLRGLVTGPLLDVPDPRLRVLEQTPATFLRVRIGLTDARPT